MSFPLESDAAQLEPASNTKLVCVAKKSDVSILVYLEKFIEDRLDRNRRDLRSLDFPIPSDFGVVIHTSLEERTDWFPEETLEGLK